MQDRFTWATVESGARRGGGFYHLAELKDNKTGRVYPCRVNYCNRTWEPWPFYTAKRGAVAAARAALEEEAVDAAKRERLRAGYPPLKRVTKEYRRQAVSFFGDGQALIALDGVRC